jgi:hypothetical protein
VLHFDIKEMVISLGGYRYIVFLIDEHSRFVFYDFIKRKSEAPAAVERGMAAFNAIVGTPVDAEGRALPRPRVLKLHSDREGGLMSHGFREFRSKELLHHTTSPSHDHDLNPIAERIIGLIAEMSTAIRVESHASPRLWPWIIAYAVDWHNSAITAVGSSTADANISPHQRITLRPPSVMDLAAFGCRAIVLKPPTHLHKPSLAAKGWVGAFLGRSRNSKGSYDVLVDGNRVVPSSSVIVDEEHFDWAPSGQRHRPLTSKAHASAPASQTALPLPAIPLPAGSNVSAPSTYQLLHKSFLNLFSGPYSRADGLSSAMKAAGWDRILQIDNDGEKGGGWSHDLLNDAAYSSLLRRAHAGDFATLMIAFPCSTSSIARFFDASNGDGGDRGPPIIRTHEYPDGLPEGQIDPRYLRELRNSNTLLERTVDIAIAARRSPARTTIIFENPADRSPGASIASAPEFANHGAIFQTTAFKRLIAEADLTSHVTFAYCRLGSDHQKYTTLYYTPEAGSVLDELNGPDYQCNHPKGSHDKRAGGRDSSGKFVSAEAAAYPHRLCVILARAFTVARSGSEVMPSPLKPQGLPSQQPRVIQGSHHAHEPSLGAIDLGGAEPVANAPSTSVPSSSGIFDASEPSPSPSAGRAPGRAPPSPVSFKNLSTGSRAAAELRYSGGPQLGDARGSVGSYWQRQLDSSVPADSMGRRMRPTAERVARASAQRAPLSPVNEAVTRVSEAATPSGSSSARHYDSNDEAVGAYSPFASSPSLVMEAAVAASVFDAAVSEVASGSVSKELIPITGWTNAGVVSGGTRLPGGYHAVEIEVGLSADHDTSPEATEALHACVIEALRADSPDAPATHAEAMQRGEVWVKSEAKELNNHKVNGSWETITRDELPSGRRVHKLIWVYKVKRDGTAKSRLCVQGTTLEAGVDYQQVFSAALRHSSARALFAYAARNGCSVRSVDLVAAYLQGQFLDGEVVYCHLPPGHPEFDPKGRPKLAKVKKPIYGIQQAGRRLQRMLFEWLKAQGFEALDDSDPCIFKRECPGGEILTVGLYVDNLQLVHSVKLDASGRGPEGCAYNSFMDALTAAWDVTDEGPMEDLLGIEIEYKTDGSIKLHQQAYIEKIVKRFLPDGLLSKAQRNALPYSKSFLSNVNDALSRESVDYPELVQPMQERIGCLMYATTSTRPDIAYPVHQLCKCMHKPTPELMAEVDHVLTYLSRTASLGLTYTREHARLQGFADASWETRTSTSGWVVSWQSAALTWGSRKQKSIALSTCEAEIIALSEATKDVVYLRKLVKGLDAPELGPTSLSTDSKSARDVSYNPEHHDKMKHVERRHFFVRDMVESFELEVPYVPTDKNPADFFTKPMSNASSFREFRKLVMNLPED